MFYPGKELNERYMNQFMGTELQGVMQHSEVQLRIYSLKHRIDSRILEVIKPLCQKNSNINATGLKCFMSILKTQTRLAMKRS